MSDETRMTEYQSDNGSTVKLSPSIVRQYLVSGHGNVTDQEVMMFLMLCKQQKLDPFQKDAYLIKYSDRDPATIVVGKDTFTKRAESDPDFRGFEAGVIVMDDAGEITLRPGSLMLPGEVLPIGGWARVYKAGREVPYYVSVSFDEYAGRKSDGDLNRQWASKPATMIRKVALVQALREAFPKSFSGLYDQSEMGVEEPVSNAAPKAPKDVTPPKPAPKKEIPTEEELEPIINVFVENLELALIENRITKVQYDECLAAKAKHIKAGDFEQFASFTIARLPKSAPEQVEEAEQVVEEQPEIF